MAWRLHLTNRSIQQLDILPDNTSLLAAWWRRDRVSYYDLQSGALIAEEVIAPPEVDDRNSLRWQEFVSELKAPNGCVLPLVTTDHEVIFMGHDPQMRFYHAGGIELFWQSPHGTDEIKLEVRAANDFYRVGLDRSGDVIAGLDNRGKLHVYRKLKRVGAHDLGLKVKDDARPSLAVVQGGEKFFAADNRRLVLVDNMGKVQRAVAAHYLIGRMVSSPDGKWVATSDAESGVVRVYEGENLTQTHQRFAIDLLASATQIQLLADLPPVSIALNAMTIDNEGNLALAMSGILCVTSLEHMDKVGESSLV